MNFKKWLIFLLFQKRVLGILGSLMGGMGGGSDGASEINMTAPVKVISPIQMPGIVSPSIYIQNTQAAPIYPILQAPNIDMNLNIQGLEDYYNHKDYIVRRVLDRDYMKHLRFLADGFADKNEEICDPIEITEEIVT